MPEPALSRRSFLTSSAASALSLAATAALADPAQAAAQAVGVKRADLPDLTIKEVKVYVINRPSAAGPGPAASGAPPRVITEQVASIVTNSGIEGNYTLENRYFHPQLEQPRLARLRQAHPPRQIRPRPSPPHLAVAARPPPPGQLSYASAIDNCLWDIMGKAVNLPTYRVLGAYRDKVMAYGSSQHHKNLEDFVIEVKRCKEAGFKAYKIHPPGGTAPNEDDYKLDIEVCKAVRQAVGDDFILMLTPSASTTAARPSKSATSSTNSATSPSKTRSPPPTSTASSSFTPEGRRASPRRRVPLLPLRLSPSTSVAAPSTPSASSSTTSAASPPA